MNMDKKYDRKCDYLEFSNEELTNKLQSFSPGCLVVASKNMSGGFANTNTLVSLGDGSTFIVRFPQSGNERFALECVVLKFLEGKVPSPKIFYHNSEFAIVEYVPGILLSEFEWNRTDCWLEAVESVGATLAKIHQIGFEEAGFLGADLQIREKFSNGVGNAFMEYISSCLQSETVHHRMGEDLHRRAIATLPELRELVGPLSGTQLVHSDFNPKNILVSATEGKWELAAVIDWEFAHSGSGLSDLGNFFRFEDEYPDGTEAAFLKGYAAAGGTLPENWRSVARVLDLASMCNFLEAANDAPNTIRTARTVFSKTIEYLHR